MATGDRAGARAAYERMSRTGAVGASGAAMGLADLAIYEGRYADAVRILVEGLEQQPGIETKEPIASPAPPQFARPWTDFCGEEGGAHVA